MRSLISAGLAFAILCVGAVSRVSADATADELAKLQGTWVITSMARGGQPDAKFDYTKVVIKGDKMQFYVAGHDDEPQSGYKIGTIDPSKSPATIDLVTDDGGKHPTPAVYKLDGDTLQICMYKGGRERPTEVATGKSADLITMKRQAK